MREPIPFTGNTLDRASNLRRDAAWLQDHLSSTATRFLALSKLNPLVHDREAPELLWLDVSVRGLLPDAACVFLGLREGVAHFGIDVSTLEEPLVALGLSEARFGDTRALATALPVEEAGLIAHARSLIDWHARHGFCPNCGSPTVPAEGYTSRKCGHCGASHFPRTDPVVIMVVWNGDECLLGSRPGRGTNYSALAGYIDQGESIEEAVRREVLEEVGVVVDDIEYYTSQPWPFPSTLMIGCFAHAAGKEINVDPVEIEHARWFSRDEVLRAVATPPDPDAGFTVPGRVAIANHLIRAWAEGVGRG